MMILLRRLPPLLCTYKYRVYSILILAGTLVYFLFKWNLFCSNFQARKQAQKMCKYYEHRRALGTLCAPICFNNDIQSFECHTFGSTKEAVFSVDLHNTRLVFKSAPTDVRSLHWFENGVIKYPNEKDFLSAIKAVVRNKLNMTVTDEIMSHLIHLKPSYEEESLQQRRKEMDNIWILVQDTEFLLSTIYSDKDIFPQMLGTCGSFFAVEYVEPLQDASSLLSHSDSKDNWAKRLRTSLQILDLLEGFETSLREPFYLCDMKLEHFGVVKAANKLKFIDLDGVFPNSVINKILSSTNNCERDEDCTIYDCKSKCLKPDNKCAGYLINSNLQIVCEKIFLGWRLSNTVIIPGLLMSEHTPSELAAILRQCANLHSEDRRSRQIEEEEIRERLIGVLTEIEQSVNSDLYF